MYYLKNAQNSQVLFKSSHRFRQTLSVPPGFLPLRLLSASVMCAILWEDSTFYIIDQNEEGFAVQTIKAVLMVPI
ncbi:MAG: hypothetical protein LUC47_10470, partial [Clostridiales bacterium]|nr:hypothetical protein [Clostridiales bacterium]